ncbi:MAG: DUF4276 family protein [bacterium]|nr:DUF4276 family protein [bacterium]
MTTIGLIGEDPYDTDSITNLLSKRYANCIFKPILRTLKGSHLDTLKTMTMLKKESKSERHSIIIYIRDLDGPETNKKKKREMREWFKKLEQAYPSSWIFLLNIYELEALILADIESFNRLFSSQISYKGNPMIKANPKEFLTRGTRRSRRKFKESANPDVFSKLDINKLIANCAYFKKFIAEFDKKIKTCVPVEVKAKGKGKKKRKG